MVAKEGKFSFYGKGGELFVIYIVNLLLTIVTLGIYSFWARVKVTKYLFENTEYEGERFGYHATGMEKFIGFLKAAGIILVVVLLLQLINWVLLKTIGLMAAEIVSALLMLSLMIGIGPIIIVGSRRFLLSRTSYRNLRFKFSGTIQDLYKDFVIGILLTIVTLGIYGAWFNCRIQRFLVDNSQFGSEKFKFEGQGKDLFIIFITGILLSIVTIGVYYFWFLARITRFFINNSSFRGHKFNSEITGGQLLVTSLLALAVTLFTLGLGLPWAIAMFLRLYIETISIEGEIDFSTIVADKDEGASALADGVSTAGEALDAVGSFLT